jgi:hypothetical protein
MRTPLSRLRVACDGETDLQRLRERVTVKWTACSNWSKTPCNWPGRTPSVHR